MLRGVLTWLTSRIGDGEDDADKESADGEFVPSPLDVSVRYAHGGGKTEADRELADIEEEAQQLANQQRER